jgi:CheY-like chemotaxis protein
MKVLLAEDDPTLRFLMRNLLQGRLGYEVVVTNDGLEAWQALCAGLTPDLCIFDLLMPQLGGLELLTKLRADERFAKLKVVLCSSINERSTILASGKLGISSYLLKPFVADKFLSEVRKICEPRPPDSQLPLEPLNTALDRLGCAKPVYMEMLGIFTTDVAGLVNGLRAPGGMDRAAVKLRMGAILGAGRSLGAAPLMLGLASLDRALSASDESAFSAIATNLEEENGRIIAAAASLA